MLYYDKIDIGEGIDLAKSNNSKECMIFQCMFFSHGYKFKDSVCNGCHDLTILSVYIRDIVLTFSLFKTIFFNLFCLVYMKWLLLWTSIIL